MDRRQLRQAIARNVDDLWLGTVSSMNVNNVRSNDFLRFPDDAFNDAELFVYSGTGIGQSRFVEDFTKANGEFDIFGSWTTAPVADDLFEVHRKWLVAQYNEAIDRAHFDVEDVYLTDKVDETLTLEQCRYEYPIPSGFRYLAAVLDDVSHLDGQYWGSGNYDADQAVAAASANTRVAQAFRISGADMWLGSVRLYLRKIGSPTATLTLTIETDISGSPSGTTVQNGSATLAASSVATTPGYAAFSFSAPVFLERDTTYWIVLKRQDGSTDVSNYVAWGRDDSTRYSNGGARLYDGASWSTVASAALLFALGHAANTARFETIPTTDWDVLRNSGRLLVKNPVEGRPLRLVGQGQATAPTADTSTIGLPEEYVIAKATALVLAMRPGGPQTDPDDRMRWAVFWENKAEALRRRLFTQPRPSSRVVEAR